MTNIRSFFFRRHHLNNWSMAKENHVPVTLNSGETSSSKLLKTRQNSLENTTTKNATDLFDLLARCQSQRLDDQRCALPSYFSQVS